MKKIIFVSAFFVLAFGSSFAQKVVPYNVVFDLTGRDTSDHRRVIRWINEILEDYPEANVEVVFYGKSLGMVTKDKSIVADQIQKLSTHKNVAFKVCEVAMKNNDVTKSMLLPGVQTVPDGIYEIVQKQGNGWGYIKVANY